MNVGIVIILCVIFLLVGFELGSWKEGRAVSNAIDDLSAMHYKEIQTIINKILELKGNKK